jgi:hypothetical protein
MEKALQAIAVRLEMVEQQPALTLTPARFRTEIDSVAHGAVSTISRPFVEAVQEARAAARDLKVLTGRVHERREQRTWLLTAGVLGLIVGVGLWYVAAGLLPRSAGDGIAASLIGGARWQAGATLSISVRKRAGVSVSAGCCSTASSRPAMACNAFSIWPSVGL